MPLKYLHATILAIMRTCPVYFPPCSLTQLLLKKKLDESRKLRQLDSGRGDYFLSAHR